MLKQKLMIVVGLLLAVAAASGTPVSAADKETRQMMADIRMLQEQTQQLQNLIGTIGKQMSDALEAAVKSQNARIDSKLDEQAANNTKAFANLKVTIDTINRDVNVLREKVDESNVRVGTLSQEVTAVRQLVTQVNAVRAASDADFGAPDSVTLANQPSGGSLATGESPQRVFESARGDYSGGQYSLAIVGFNQYLKMVPPKSDMADDAQVFIGNSYLQDKQYDKAVDAYDLAIRNYPTGDMVPQAYWKKGLALLDLNRKEEADAAFDYVVKNFPNTNEAILAKQRLTPATKP